MPRLHCLRKQILALLVLSAALMFGTSVIAQKGNLSWREDLSAIGGDVHNVMNTPDGLTLGDEGYAPKRLRDRTQLWSLYSASSHI
jgi:hypothetical protein